jgi:aspartate carbamoyltransferase catalytic subunit
MVWCYVCKMSVWMWIIFRQLEYAQQYGVDKTLLDSLNKEIMHPGPINRGVEITSKSHQSVILNQVENGSNTNGGYLSLAQKSVI